MALCRSALVLGKHAVSRNFRPFQLGGRVPAFRAFDRERVFDAKFGRICEVSGNETPQQGLLVRLVPADG
jgi:hypothetical protein